MYNLSQSQNALLFTHLFYLFWRCYHTTCQNTGDSAGPTSLNSNMRMVLNVTDGLGLVSLSPTACDSQSQSRLTLLPSSSLHVSVKSFMTLVKFTSSVSSLISILRSSVHSGGPAVCEAHINLRYTQPAFASRAECFLCAVVYVSCPQLVSLLVVFACFLSPSTWL